MSKRIRPARHYQHPREAVRRLADHGAPPIGRALAKALEAAARGLDAERVTYLLRNGRYGEVVDVIDWRQGEEAMKRPLSMLGDVALMAGELGERKINGAFNARGRKVRYGKGAELVERANHLDAPARLFGTPAIDIVKDQADLFNFDRFSPETLRAIRALQDEFIRELSTKSRNAIERAILAGLQQGLTPEAMVTRIKRAVGLTSQQAEAVERFREQLLANDPRALQRVLVGANDAKRIRAAVAAGAPLDVDVIDRMVDRYAFRYRDYRALTIARTETTNASALGLQLAYEQLVERGAAPREAITQHWKLALDERTCDHCISVVDMNPDGVKLGQPFQSDHGPVKRPSLHPSCRCSLEMALNLDLIPA